MGIPSFYAWLKKRYPLIKIKLEDEAREIPIVDNMFIDFNALIYRCVREQNNFLVNQLNPRSVEEIHERVFEYLEELVDQVNPQKLLLIGFDGVVPRAKVNQSRERRFKASKQKQRVDQFYKLLGIEDSENFKLNSISPGTQFLYNLCNKLKAHILNKMDSDWRHLNVIYSDCCTPGQGQQKILEFMRIARDKGFFNENSTHCVYSPDADLFLLMLSTRINNIYIIREEFVWSKSTTEAHLRKQSTTVFQMVFINILRQYFELEFQQVKGSIKNFDIYRVIDDFILIMMFVGNDFLPKSFSYNIKEGHLTELLVRYKEYLTNRSDYLNDKGKINWANTEQLLKIASEFEVKLIQQKLAKHMQYQKYKESKEKEKQNQEESEPQEQNFIKEFMVEDNKLTKGRTYYYQSRFKFDPEKPQNRKLLDNIIEKYIEGLEFYVTYYYLGCQSWSWFYPYHYAPLLVDVYQYIENKKVKQIKLKDKGQPLDPFMALMFMVPEQSFGLLPSAIKETLMSKQCKLRAPLDYYPLKFDMDPFVPASDFEQKALIPFLDEKLVRQVYSSIPKQKYSKEELERNTKKNNTFFRRTGEGKMQRTSGVQFNISRQNDVNELATTLVKPSTERRQRFPSLKVYGNDIKVDKNSIIIYVDRQYTPIKDELIYFNHFQGIVEEVDRIDKDTAEQIENQYSKVGLVGRCENYVRAKLVRLVRYDKGYKLVKTLRQVIVPDFAIFKTPDYDYLRRSHIVEPLTRFAPLDRVVILNKTNFGDIGVIEGTDGDLYTLRILERSQTLAEKVQQNQQTFYTLRYACQQLQLTKEVLYAVLDEVIVRTNQKQDFGQILPEQWNLGLSLIDRKRGLVVPKYVRCQHQYQNPKNPYAIFDYLEISETGLRLIREYMKELSVVISALKTEMSKNGGKLKNPIPFDKILKNGQNIDIARLYQKLYNLEAKGRQYRIYSKITLQIPKWIAQQKVPGVLKIHPRYLMSKAEARISPLPYLCREPQYHMVGDRVTVTRTHQTGVVIGIDDNFMVVRFPKKLRSYKLQFTKIFNEKWADSLQKQQGPPWNLDYSYYSPSYWTKAVDFNPQ